MKVLLSNDDGIHAPGLKALEAGVASVKGLDIIKVIAPDRDCSAASNSLTLDRPLRVTELDERHACVNGTPTDSVHLAVCGWLDRLPDLVVSGINHGANLGDDVIYSGTVAAATEGRFLGYPAIAMSLDCRWNDQHQYFETAAQVAADILTHIQQHPLPKTTVLNVNVPNVPYEQLKGLRTTRLGERHRAEPLVVAHDPRGRNLYWVGQPGAHQDASEPTDFYAIANGYVSITPLQIDLTHYEAMESLQHWTEGCLQNT